MFIVPLVVVELVINAFVIVAVPVATMLVPVAEKKLRPVMFATVEVGFLMQ